MASDEVLLELAEEGVCSLRFYTWAEPTVSLGYFQSTSCLLNSKELKNLPWVRRATGGEALVHDHELTYALGLPLKLAGQKSTLWQEKMHVIIQKALSRMGVSMPEINLPEQRNDPTNLLCFHHHAPQDLIINRHKIVGSAQRKKKRSVIQHGGILLAQSKYTPSLPGILELSGKIISPKKLGETIVDECRFALGWTFNDSEWSPEEQARIQHYVKIRFDNTDWNNKR
ncbi:MAG: lipoate--protein ligase family protein [Planctomycetes bacterium]|nr:lipoate--protein ligase family protein [Planctomycetota bacterium]NBY03141.1 lipoate--protein ligase family protein [Planctomycetota bacterium]